METLLHSFYRLDSGIVCRMLSDLIGTQVEKVVKYITYLFPELTRTECLSSFTKEVRTRGPTQVPFLNLLRRSPYYPTFLFPHAFLKNRCPRSGWGFPTSGDKEVWNYCQANKKWNLTAVEDCELLPCPTKPPPKMEGGWKW